MSMYSNTGLFLHKQPSTHQSGGSGRREGEWGHWLAQCLLPGWLCNHVHFSNAFSLSLSLSLSLQLGSTQYKVVNDTTYGWQVSCVSTTQARMVTFWEIQAVLGPVDFILDQLSISLSFRYAAKLDMDVLGHTEEGKYSNYLHFRGRNRTRKVKE